MSATVTPEVCLNCGRPRAHSSSFSVVETLCAAHLHGRRDSGRALADCQGYVISRLRAELATAKRLLHLSRDNVRYVRHSGEKEELAIEIEGFLGLDEKAMPLGFTGGE